MKYMNVRRLLATKFFARKSFKMAGKQAQKARPFSAKALANRPVVKNSTLLVGAGHTSKSRGRMKRWLLAWSGSSARSMLTVPAGIQIEIDAGVKQSYNLFSLLHIFALQFCFASCFAPAFLLKT